MDPYQTAPKREQSDLGSYCLRNRLHTNIKQMREQGTKVFTGVKGLVLSNSKHGQQGDFFL